MLEESFDSEGKEPPQSAPAIWLLVAFDLMITVVHSSAEQVHVDSHKQISLSLLSDSKCSLELGHMII